MKKTILNAIFGILIVTLMLTFTEISASAQSPSPKITPTKSPVKSIKDQLITNIASRVAQLNLVEKRGIVGKVVSVTNTQIIFLDIQNNTRFIDVDELTKFSNPSFKGSYGISDITKDTTLGILGLYNKDSQRILARFINVISIPSIVKGVIASVDRNNFQFEILDEENKQTAVDVESFTKTYSFTPKNGSARAGFSQLKENIAIIAVIEPDSKIKNKINANRIVIFPELPLSPKIKSLLQDSKASSK